MDSSAQSTGATRPDPIVTPDAAFFGKAPGAVSCWRSAVELRGPGAPPRPIAPRCHSVDREWVRLSGRGKVDSWIIPRHPPALGFTQPPIVALIRLEEGIRLVSNVVGVTDGQVAIGLEVEVLFDPTVGGFAVPVFRPRTG